MKDLMLMSISLVELEELIKRCVEEGLNGGKFKAQNEEKDEVFLTVEEAAKFLKVSRVSIHNWKRDKGLPYHRLGRSIRFKKNELMEFAKLKKR